MRGEVEGFVEEVSLPQPTVVDDVNPGDRMPFRSTREPADSFAVGIFFPNFYFLKKINFQHFFIF